MADKLFNKGEKGKQKSLKEAPRPAWPDHVVADRFPDGENNS